MATIEQPLTDRQQLIMDATTDARAGMVALDARDFERAAVLFRLALDQLDDAGVLVNV
jgi:hypothetical protein